MDKDEWIKKIYIGTSLVAQWLRFCASTIGGVGLIPGQGTKIPHATWCGQKKKEKRKENVHTHTYTHNGILLSHKKE